MDADLENIINQFCKEQDIKQYSVEDISWNQVGEGFLGEITFFTLIDKSNGKELNLVVKKAFKQAAKRLECKIRQCFLNEINAYTKVLPKFFQMQRDMGFQDDILDFTFKCYSTCTEDTNEYLILDNGKALGYKMVSKNQSLDTNHLELIFKRYAQFHSLSLVLHQQRPELYEEAKKCVTNLYMTIFNNPPTARYVDNIVAAAKQSLKPDDSQEIKTKIEENYCNEKWLNSFMDFEEAKFKVLVHGDCWSNNLMFKYDDLKPIDVKLLDWQLISYRSPICDLSYCFYSGSNKSQYDQLDKYLQIYHDSLIASLQKFKYDFKSNPLITFDELKDEWKKYCKFGFIMGLMLIKLKKMSEDQGPEGSGKKSDSDQIRDLVLHMHDINAL